MKEFFKNPWAVSIGAGLIVLLVSYYIFGIDKNNLSPGKIIGSIVTENQSGGNNTVINNPTTLRIEEDFSAFSLRDSFTASSSDEILHIKLKNYPIPGSVNLWWGAMSLNPLDYKIVGKEVQVNFSQDQAEAIKKVVPGSIYESGMSFVVTYIPDTTKE